MATTKFIKGLKYESTDFNGLVTQNNLGYLWMTQPHLLSKQIEQISRVNLQDDTMALLNRFKTEEVPIERQYEWLIAGNTSKNIPLVAVSDINDTAFTASSRIGLNRARFKMVFAEDYFYPDFIIVGMNPDAFGVRIVEAAEKLPTGYYAYECELLTNSLSTFITLNDVAVGTRWSVDYTLTETTLSKRGTGTHHTSPARMFTEMSFMRKEYEVPGNMISAGSNQPLEFYFADENNKPIKTWINKLDYDFHMSFRREQANVLVFGKSNRISENEYYNTGASGYQIKAGSGIREQIAPANINYYSDFNLNSFIDYLLSLSIGKLPEDSRKFVIMTGERGMTMLARAFEKTPSLGALYGDSNFATDRHIANALPNRYSGPLDSLAFNTGQIKKFKTVQGIEIEVVKMASYDDPVRNKIYHPTLGGLAESYRLTILDYGTTDGRDNIVRLKPKGDPEMFGGYIQGLRSPFAAGGFTNSGSTPTTLPQMSTEVDAYKIHCAWYGGIAVKNPLRMGEWIPNVLY